VPEFVSFERQGVAIRVSWQGERFRDSGCAEWELPTRTIFGVTFDEMAEAQRYIAHFDLDAFFVSVECLLDPSLKGKPLLVGGRERGVVAACSYEARKFGIHSAMPMKTAMRLCPQATVVGSTRGEYSRYSRWVTEIIAAKAPLFEKASIDDDRASGRDHGEDSATDLVCACLQ
jgi:hypothetical protein